MIRPSNVAGPESSKSTMSRQNVASIYPLRPNQVAWLWQSEDPHTDPGFLEIQFQLRGIMNPQVFASAWQWLVNRHEALRMSIHFRESLDPLIMVWQEVDAALQFHDWRELSKSEQQHKFQFLMEDNARSGLSVDSPPVNRVDVYQVSDDLHQVIWRCHHVFLDGWSSAMLVNEWLSAYDDLLVAETPQASSPKGTLRDYLKWLNERDQNRYREFWQQRLQAFSDASDVGRIKSSVEALQPEPFQQMQISLDHAASSKIENLLRDHQLTASALCQGIWALMLSQIYNRQKVIFGNAVSGRSIPLEGLSKLVGMLSNVLPVFVKIVPDQSLGDWLRRLRDQAFETFAYESTSPVDIESWRTRATGPLYESLLVVENFPEVNRDANHALQIEEYRSSLSSINPLTVGVIPGDCWLVQLRYDSQRIDNRATEKICQTFVQLLESVCQHIDQPVATLAATPVLQSLSSVVDLECRTASDESRNSTTCEPASNPVEDRLLMIWQDILGLEQIGVTDHFFEIGGRSITAVRLFAEIQDAFGKRLSPATLLEYPTISRLAKLMGNDPTCVASPVLVPIRSVGHRPPLVCVHVGGGYALYYRHLAKHLDLQRPVYGLQPPGLDGSQPLESIAAIADCYVDQLLEKFPHGPVHLLGYCVGGSVSVEMARRLIDRGIPVLSLTILDSGPAAVATRKSFGEFRARKTPAQICKGIAHHLVFRCHSCSVRFRRWLGFQWRTKFGSTVTKRRAWLEFVEQVSRRAFLSFQQKPVDLPVLLLRSTNYIEMQEKNFHLKWGDYTPDLEIRIVDIDHESLLLEPGVARIASIVESRLLDRE